MAEKDFQYYKKWALGVLKKQYDALDKKEKENKKVSKAFSLAEKEMEKAFPVGTIRTWKGKKFIKSPDKKWRPYYEKHNSAGAKRAIANIARQINSLEDGDFEGLYNILKLHKSRFAGQENQLMEIYKLAKEKGAKVGGRFSAEKNRQEAEERQGEIDNIEGQIEEYHEYVRDDMKSDFYEPNNRTDSERLALANEAKVFDALYGKEWREGNYSMFGSRLEKDNDKDNVEEGEQEKWFQRIEEAIDFAENYQNMANSDNAVDAMGVLCAGDAYTGQGDMFSDSKNTFTDKEKKNIKAYEALSGETLPKTKDEVAKYFKDKRKIKPEPKEKESKKEKEASLPKIEGISEKEIKEAYEGLSEEDKEFLTSRLDRNVNFARFKEAAKESLEKYSNYGWDNTLLDAKELKREYETKKAAYERNKHDAEIIKRAWETPTIVEESSLGYDLKGDTGEYINGTDYQGNRTFPFGLYKTKKEVDQFERIKSRLASLACKVNDMVVSLCKDEADFFKEMYTKKKKDPGFNARDSISYEKFEKWQKEKGGKEEKKSKTVKKSFCYFDKTGRLWFRKSAFQAG